MIHTQNDDNPWPKEFTVTIYGKTINGQNIVCSHINDFNPISI